MKYQVVEDHRPDNHNPIQVRKGETVKVGRESVEDDGWCNWIYCYSLDNSSEGWTPIQIVQVENEYGVILDDYSAYELDVNKDDIVNGEVEVNGWLWCCKADNYQWGWVPKEKIIIKKSIQ